VYLLVFQAYINEMRGSRSKIPSKKNLVMQRCVEGFNSIVKGLRMCIATPLLPLQAFTAHTGTTSSFYYAAGLKRQSFFCVSMYIYDLQAFLDNL
jgi:hypothetical protein